jgi:hypothetical protein
MLYEIAKELREELRARSVPFPVVYGPERTASTSITQNRIVVEFDPEGSERYTATRATRDNPKVRGIVEEPMRATIYAQSTLPGAAVQDHQRLAFKVRDQYVIALEKVLRTRKVVWDGTQLAGRFMPPEAMGIPETWHGVALAVFYPVPRAIEERSWEGEALEEATFGTDEETSIGIESCAQVFQTATEPEGEGEHVCGDEP